MNTFIVMFDRDSRDEAVKQHYGARKPADHFAQLCKELAPACPDLSPVFLAAIDTGERIVLNVRVSWPGTTRESLAAYLQAAYDEDGADGFFQVSHMEGATATLAAAGEGVAA